MSKILFLTTAHNYNDDRIFYHQGKELKSHGFEVKISSLHSEYKGIIEGIEIESYSFLQKTTSEKIRTFEEICTAFQPDCIICSEPLAVIAAKKYAKVHKSPIIYDITEWYPSMRMVRQYGFVMKIIHTLKFFLIQLYAGYISDFFIFGEKTKLFPLGYFYPWKKKIILPYYPDDIYVKTHINKLQQNEIKLCYTGLFSKEKGIENFFNVADYLRKQRPELKVSLILIGGTRSEDDEQYFSNLLSIYKWENIKIDKPVPFYKFTESYSDADICFDLRDINVENNNCLPIKLFYYMASGKPVIYSDLKATKKHVDVSRFGFLVDPEDYKLISDYILRYVDNHQLYENHAKNARRDFEEKYNWRLISSSFINFIRKTIEK